MTRDIETLTNIIRICLAVAAFFTTLFPVIYLLFPWQSTRLGRLLMLQAVSFALALDMTLLFTFWMPGDVLVIFWTNALVFFLIAISTCLLTVMLWKTNRDNRLHHNRLYKRRKTDV